MSEQAIDWEAVLSDAPPELVVEAAENVFSLDPVKKRFERYRYKINDMKQKAEKHEVTDDASNTNAVAMASQAKSLAKELDKLSKEIVAEPNKFVKGVRSFTKGFTEPLGQIEASLKRKVADYQYKLRLEAQKREAEERKARAELQKKMDEEAKAANVEPVKLPDPVQSAPPKVTRTESGSAHIRMKWTATIEDESKVPREYCVPSQKLINQAVKDGIRTIPGVNIFEEPITTIRT